MNPTNSNSNNNLKGMYINNSTILNKTPTTMSNINYNSVVGNQLQQMSSYGFSNQIQNNSNYPLYNSKSISPLHGSMNNITSNTKSNNIVRLQVLLEKSKWFNIYKKIKRNKRSNENENVIEAINKQPGNNETLYYFGESPSKRWGHTANTLDNKMIIFGGRHSSKSLGTMHLFDPANLTWTKIENGVNWPLTRDSHTSVIYNKELYIFGGTWQDKKLNDLWKFNFEEKKWIKLNVANPPTPVEGHSSSLVLGNRFMMIQGGLDESNEVVSNLHLFDMIESKWFKCEVNNKDSKVTARECRSCVSNGDFCYLFGGENKHGIFNDLFKVSFSFSKEKGYQSNWILENPVTLLPPERSSHSCIFYEPEFLIITGGEGRDKNDNSVSLNDTWVYHIATRSYYMLKDKDGAPRSNRFESRMFHSATLIENKIIIFGGLIDSDTTIDTISILSLEGKQVDKTGNISNAEIHEKVNQHQSQLKETIKEEIKNGEHLIISHQVEYLNKKRKSNQLSNINISVGVDTSDLNNFNQSNFNELKREYVNNYISWKFLKDQASYFQFPLSCIMTFVDNAAKPEVKAKKISINMYCFDSPRNISFHEVSEYDMDEPYFSIFEPNNIKNIKDKVLCLSIKDNGKGMDKDEFNQSMISYSDSGYQNVVDNHAMKFGLTMKFSAIRLASSFFLVSKSENYLSFGLISKNLSKKIDEDLVFIPVVNYWINKNVKDSYSGEQFENNPNIHPSDLFNIKYVSQNPSNKVILNMIFPEIIFMFKDKENFYDYCNKMTTGTQVFIFNLNQIHQRDSFSSLDNYELSVNLEKRDIIYNLFNKLVPRNNLIDCSLKEYIMHYYLIHPENLTITLFGESLNLVNPLYTVYLQNTEKTKEEVHEINSGLLYNNSNPNKTQHSCIRVNCELYSGIIFNDNYLNSAFKNVYASNLFQSNIYDNGVLVYKDNILVLRYLQKVLGDYTHFFGYEMTNINNKAFTLNGFVQVKSKFAKLLPNKADFAEIFVRGTVQQGIYSLANHIEDNNN